MKKLKNWGFHLWVILNLFFEEFYKFASFAMSEWLALVHMSDGSNTIKYLSACGSK